MKLDIKESGFIRKTLELHNEEVIDIHVDKRVNASLFLTYVGIDANIVSSITLEEGSSMTIMMKNELQKTLLVKQQVFVKKDAHIQIAFVELENGKSDYDCTIDLLKQGASALIRSACVSSIHKHFHMVCNHQVPYTSSTMENYAIVKEHGDYRMKACGKIVKGAYGSASHQTSRVLTMSDTMLCEVIPLLLIDENDVKASHATSVGQPDENQLYYLQTRGLNRNMALGLLTVGYLMPVAELFEDRDIQQELKNEIEMKVGLHD